MKNKSLKMAHALCLFALMGFGSSAYAMPVIIDFTGESNGGGGEVTIDGFVFSDVQVSNSGNCIEGGGSDECINLTVGDEFTLSEENNSSFTLKSFWINFTGNGVGELTVATSVIFTGANENYTACNTGVEISGGCERFALGASTSFLFESTGVANIRLDDFALDCPECGGVDVPEPGTLALLGLGLLGLSVSRRRKV